ncbi:MAG: SDR family oxidoreductase [Desulfurococcales archaeon]|nr:SDR family oxidoreductase [Desulfurococcales archaeon]
MKVAVITGASGGIGAATALRFAREGYVLILTYRGRRDRCLEVAREAEKRGSPRAYAINLDLTDANSIGEFVEKVSDLVPYVNALVNNAGVLQVGPVERVTLEEWEHTLKVNLTGPFLLTKHLLPLLRKAPWASIVNVASIAGETGNVVAGVAYAASKAGLIGFTKRLAVELAPEGIRVNAVAPSFVETDMVKEFISTPEGRRRVIELHPLRIIIQPEDVAEAILFLADPERSRAITGHVLRINAGRLT